jgi:hypothetical protein
MSEENKRKAVPAKTRMKLQQETDSKCPFCGDIDVEHHEVHHIGEKSNSKYENLILLCRICHSKTSSGEISESEIIKKKNELMQGMACKKAVQKPDVVHAMTVFNASVDTSITGHSAKVVINKITKKTVKQQYPPGCIGHNLDKAGYIGHLIQRYHEWKEKEIGKANMKYAIFPSELKRMYKIGSGRSLYTLKEEKFDELSRYIQYRIDNTLFGKRNKYKNYSRFEEWIQKKS